MVVHVHANEPKRFSWQWQTKERTCTFDNVTKASSHISMLRTVAHIIGDGNLKLRYREVTLCIPHSVFRNPSYTRITLTWQHLLQSILCNSIATTLFCQRHVIACRQQPVHRRLLKCGEIVLSLTGVVAPLKSHIWHVFL